MANKFRIKFTPAAEDDLDEIFRYITEQLSAPKAADHLLEEIEAHIMQMQDFPYSGSLVADEILAGKGYRKLVVKNYIVFHLIDENEEQVVIIRILYGARRFEDITVAGKD